MSQPLANSQGPTGTPTRTLAGVERDAPAAAIRTRHNQPNLLHRYIFWTYERGSFHYDVMVTLILLFLFIAPHVIDFHDRPIPEIPARSSEVLVRAAGFQGAQRRFVYEIRGEDLRDVHTDQDLRARVTETVTDIAPDATVTQIKPVKDPHGRTVAYDATVLR